LVNPVAPRTPTVADLPVRLAGDEAIDAAWRALAAVEDPEIPAISIVDLGLIRFVRRRMDGALEVGLSPTYVGCPATDVIREAVMGALTSAEVGSFVVIGVLAPPWTSDWITEEGRRKLALYGIAPPARVAHGATAHGRPVACPRCASADTETLSEFGSTPCKALHRCRQCLEPFESFKCI
jgi:ring-1,2-phenylacetyl-CoA epoxidase subunit PaaD